MQMTSLQTEQLLSSGALSSMSPRTPMQSHAHLPVLTSNFCFWPSHMYRFDIQRGWCGLIFSSRYGKEHHTHTHMLKKTTVNTRYFIQAIDMLIMHHQKLDTQRFSHFLVRCSQKTVTLVAHGKVSPRTYNMGA